MQWLNELGVLMKRCGKYKAIFQTLCDSIEDDNGLHPTSIKPLCARRWLCRLQAIQSVLECYSAVLESLREMASGTGDLQQKPTVC